MRLIRATLTYIIFRIMDEIINIPTKLIVNFLIMYFIINRPKNCKIYLFGIFKIFYYYTKIFLD